MKPTTDNTRCPVPGCQIRIEHTHEQMDSCHACGAHVPPAIGEGTCPRCSDPSGLNPPSLRRLRDWTFLFLDFDGVLHPFFPRVDRTDAQNQHFAYLPRLESVLRDHPHVRVVVSSDWRIGRTIEQLREFFSSDLRDRIIGMTAHARHGGAGSRQRQIEAWLKENAEGGTWIALDDHEDHFDPGAPVVLCADEFAEREEQLLRALLE